MPEESHGRSGKERASRRLTLLGPSLAAAGYFALLSAAALALTLSADDVQGVSAPSVRRLIATRFRAEVVASSLTALSVAVVLGLLSGALAGGLVRLRAHLLGRAPTRLIGRALGLVVVLHATLVAYDIARHPQAWALSLHARGGAGAALQIALTDWVGPRGVLLLAALGLGAWLGLPLAQRLRRVTDWRSQRALVAVVTGALAALAVPLSCDLRALGRSGRSPGEKRPNVLVIAADSLRADRLAPRTMPNVTRWAEQGVRFERAYTPLPRTFPAWVSILTGKDPHSHGIRHMFPRPEARGADLDAVPERFARSGYHTAVVSDFAGDIFRRSELGFARRRTPTFDMRELVREVVVGGQKPILPLLRGRLATRALPVLGALHDTTDPWAVSADTLDEIDRAADKPFFVVSFYSTTHFPYSAPEPFASRFRERGYRGRHRYGKTPSLSSEARPSEADIRAVRAQYDGAVSAVDDAIAALLKGLGRRGRDRDTIVVLTSDHGEALYEPGRGQGHGDHLFGDEAVHVPLVVKDPRRSGARSVSSIVRSVDIAPTLCELAELDCGKADGRSLVPAMAGREPERRLAFAETGVWFTREIPDLPAELRLPYPALTELLEVEPDAGGSLSARKDFEPLLVAAKHRMVRDERYKLVYAPTRDGVRWLLFDTESDPGEEHDVAASRPEVVRRLGAELWRWMLEDPAVERRGDYLFSRASRATAPKAAPPPAKAGSAGVFVRLTDLVASASVDAPELERTDRELEHWRRMRSPWASPPGDLGAAVQQVSLVKKPPRALRKGEKRLHGSLDPYMWNTTEGSFDQREVIFAPPPSRFRFRNLRLPPGAVLETAPAIVGPKRGGAELEVAVIGGDGRRVVVARHRLDGAERSFVDRRIDLSAHAGAAVDLELVTSAPATEGTPAVVWGSPVVTAPAQSDLPFNVLFIVVDSLRGDVLSEAHDEETDARLGRVKPAVLDAHLPRMPTVAPNLDALARRGVLFTNGYSAGTWTRPGTIAMLSGSTSGELGLGALKLIPDPADVQALYRKRPGFLPLLLRSHGVVSRAVVNNFYMVGYAGVGVDMGFEGLADHRYPLDDTRFILDDAMAELERQRARRFFLFVNFNSPHVPYQPPTYAKDAVPKPPVGPHDRIVRGYLGEVHKDDRAIGALLEKLDELRLTEDTLVIVTADHGETLSAAHGAVPIGVDDGPDVTGRFHHISSMYDETAHVPLLLVLPKRLPAGKKIADPVSTLDIVPTVLELAGIAPKAPVRGKSLLPLVRGAREPERPIVFEGRGARSLRVGRWRLVLRDWDYRHVRERGKKFERRYELYDLETDPGERVEVSRKHPEVVERLRKLASGGAPSSDRAGPGVSSGWIRLRFATAGRARRVTGSLAAKTKGVDLAVTPVGLPAAAVTGTGDRRELAFDTAADVVVGFDIEPSAPSELEWSFSLDGSPWPEARIYAGAFGLRASELARGLAGAARQRAATEREPWIDAARELGLFVTADDAPQGIDLARGSAAQQEAMELMRSWGYVR